MVFAEMVKSLSTRARKWLFLRGIQYGVLFGIFGNLFVSHYYGLVESCIPVQWIKVVNLGSMTVWGIIVYAVFRRIENELEKEQKSRVKMLEVFLDLRRIGKDVFTLISILA
jgi:hypothetical protein